MGYGVTVAESKILRVVLAVITFAISSWYVLYEDENTQELIATDIRSLTGSENEKAKLDRLFKSSEFLILNISFKDMPEDQKRFKEKSDYYVQVVKTYICSSPVLSEYFKKVETIEADLVSKSPRRAMAIFSLTKSQCKKNT